jgi:hypothetical protein
MRCKFKCRNKTEFDDGSASVHLEPVRSEENKQFFQNDPYGNFDAQGITPEASKIFVVGKEYSIEITPVEE